MPAVDAVVLAGGRGSRLSGALPGVQKVLAPIRGRPFLDYVLEYLADQGVKSLVLCIGHLQSQVEDKYRGFRAIPIRFSREIEPLGTGGAVRLALDMVESEPFVVLNGDSLCRVDLAALLAVHGSRRAQATVAVTLPDARTDVGSVWMDGTSKVTRFAEKSVAPHSSERYTNAGVYAFQQSAFSNRPPGRFSLESDLLPELVGSGTCFGYLTTEKVLDIGTPARYADAQQLL